MVLAEIKSRTKFLFTAPNLTFSDQNNNQWHVPYKKDFF